MNNQIPLQPQGSLLEQKNKGRARVKIAVFVVLAIHGVGLLALLMQGCKKQTDTTAQSEATNNPAAGFAEQTNGMPAFTNETVALATNRAAPADTTMPATPASPPTPTATEYKVAKGDVLIMIAKKFHVSLKALTEANPGIDPSKLQIGQTLHIPAPAPAATPNGGASGGLLASSDTANGPTTYSVKSGDSLTKIASQFGTTVKALRTANDLKTDRIVVGQKLRIPTKSTATNPLPGSEAPEAATTTAAVAVPPSTPTVR